MINGCRSLSYDDRLERLGLTKLEDRHSRADMILVHKILNHKNNTYPLNLLQKSDRPGRVNCLKLFKPRSRLQMSGNRFAIRVIEQWNALPNRVVLSIDEKTFKKNLDTYMREIRGQL